MNCLYLESSDSSFLNGQSHPLIVNKGYLSRGLEDEVYTQEIKSHDVVKDHGKIKPGYRSSQTQQRRLPDPSTHSESNQRSYHTYLRESYPNQRYMGGNGHAHFSRASPSPLTSSGVYSSYSTHSQRQSSPPSTFTSSYPAYTSAPLPPPPPLLPSTSISYVPRMDSPLYTNHGHIPHPSHMRYTQHRYEPSHDHGSHDWQTASWSASNTNYPPSTTYRTQRYRPVHQPYSLPDFPSPDSSPPTSIILSPRHLSYSSSSPKHSAPFTLGSPTSFIDIYSHPEDLCIRVGDSIRMTCEGRILYSSENPVYQWYKDEEPLIGEVDSCFHLKQAGKEDLGYYFCVVSDMHGEAQRKSRTACVRIEQDMMCTIPTPPVIISQPTDIVQAIPGERLILKLKVEAYPEPTFHWLRNGIDLSYATTSELIIPCVTARDEGQYICSISNEFGTILSDTFVIQLIRKREPSGLTESFGDDNGLKIALPPSYATPHNLPTSSVWSPSSPEHRYPERPSNLVEISDEAFRFLTSQICRQIGESGDINGLAMCLRISRHDVSSVRIHYSNFSEQVMKLLLLWKSCNPWADITVLEDLLQYNGFRVFVPYSSGLGVVSKLETPPVILSHPDNIQVHPGETMSMHVEVSGHDLSFQWYKDGLPYPGQTSPRIFLTDIREPFRGLYYCRISNKLGSVNSNPARLDIVPYKPKLPPTLQSTHWPSTFQGQVPLSPQHQSKPEHIYINPHETSGGIFSPPIDPHLHSQIPRRGSGDTSSLDSLQQCPFKEVIYPPSSGHNSIYAVSERMENLRMDEGTKPIIKEHPESQVIGIGEPLQLNVIAEPKENLRYLWYFNGLAIRTEKLPEFKLYCFTEDDVGDYICEVSNEVGSVVSDIAVVSLRYDDEDDEDEKVGKKGDGEEEIRRDSAETMRQVEDREN